MDDSTLYARGRAEQFAADARVRLARDVEIMEARLQSRAHELIADLQALRADAALVGFDELADAARLAEDEARIWRDRGDISALSFCLRSVQAIEGAIAMVARHPELVAPSWRG